MDTPKSARRAQRRCHRPSRRGGFVPLLAAAILTGGLTANGAALAAGNHLALYVDTVDATLNLHNPPQAGDQGLFSRAVYAADLSDPQNPQPTGPVIGFNIVVCTVAGSAGFLCHGTVELTGEGTITMSGAFYFQDPASVAVTGGTGKFAGAQGVLTSYELNPEGDQLYLFDFSAARN